MENGLQRTLSTAENELSNAMKNQDLGWLNFGGEP